MEGIRTRHALRGRGFALGLALLPSALSSCGGDGLPVSKANEDHTEPAISEVGGVRVVENRTPQELLVAYAELPSRELQPLFLGDVAAVRDDDQRG